jgi:hypothetical protein
VHKILTQNSDVVKNSKIIPIAPVLCKKYEDWHCDLEFRASDDNLIFRLFGLQKVSNGLSFWLKFPDALAIHCHLIRSKTGFDLFLPPGVEIERDNRLTLCLDLASFWQQGLI